MSLPTSFQSLPPELVDEIATLAGGDDEQFQKQLRLVDVQFSVYLAKSVFTTIHFPLSPSPSPSTIPYIEAHMHIAKAVRAIVFHSVSDAVECLRFVELCDMGRSLDDIEWCLDDSAARVPTTLLSILLPRSSVTLASHHFIPSSLPWLLQRSPRLQYLHLETASCLCNGLHEQWPPSPVPPLCSLREFVYSSPCFHPSRRIFRSNAAFSTLHAACTRLSILRVTVVPEDVPLIQSLASDCSSTLELLELTLLDGQSTGFDHLSPHAFTMTELAGVRQLIVNSGVDGINFLGNILFSLPKLHLLDSVDISLTSTDLTVTQWTALNRGMNRVRSFHKHLIEIFVRGSPVRTPEYFLHYATQGRAAGALRQSRGEEEDDEAYAMEIAVHCDYTRVST